MSSAFKHFKSSLLHSKFRHTSLMVPEHLMLAILTPLTAQLQNFVTAVSVTTLMTLSSKVHESNSFVNMTFNKSDFKKCSQ